MNFHVKAAIAIVLVGALAIFGYKYGAPLLTDQLQRGSSDARDTKGRIVVGVDNWVGYLPLCSAEMRREMRRRSYLFECHDDGADTPGRMQRLQSGEIQFAVATVDSYLLNAAAQHYPGTIVAVIDESKGGDAIVAWKDQFARIEDLKGKPGAAIAFTPNSPSEHLLKSIAVHFDLAHLKQKSGSWRLEAKGSPDALAKLLAHKSAAAVLWEPDVTKALGNPGITKLLGTENTRLLIVDVLVADRGLTQKQPELVAEVLAAYFKTLQHFADDRDALLAEARKAMDTSPAQTETLLNGVRWVSLAENAQAWLGGSGAVVDAIDGAVRILIDAGDFRDNPIPDRDPSRLVNSHFVNQLFAPLAATSQSSAPVLERRFPALDDKAWAALREVGMLRTRPIMFQSGTAELAYDGKMELDNMAESLRHYPNFRILVKGHSGVSGDPDANRRLSLERAESVARYLQVTYNMDENRLRVVGLGGAQPLPRLTDESERTYAYRLPRVEIVLVSESL
jgi:outer membrane protein OmpA-like peptidoglycan-associated protein